MKIRFITLFLFISILLNAQSTYYVATTGGNAGHTGAIDDPWLTITYAESQMSGGDTLFIREGTYVERVYIDGIDGTAVNRTVISGYESEIVIIDGEYTLPGGTGSYWYTFFTVIADNYVTLQKVTIKQSTGGLLAITGNYSYAINITGDGSYETGIELIGNYCLLDSSSMTDNGNHYGIGGQPTWGAAIGVQGDYCIVQNCTSYENRGEGLNMHKGPVGSTVQDCIAYDNQSLNLYFQGSTDCVAQRNMLYYTDDYSATSGRNITIASETGLPNHGATIINNVCWNGFVNFETDSNLSELVNVIIANNTFVNARGNWDAGYRFGVYLRTNLVYFENSIFKNNIIIEDEVAGRYPISLPSSHTGLTLDYNLWNETPVVAAIGASDVVSTPHFTDSLIYDFTLKASSPAIDAGDVVGVYEDYLEELRDDIPDIGAYEFDPPEPPAYASIISGMAKAWTRGATVENNLLTDGGGTVSRKGVCWALTTNPTVAGDHTEDGTDLGYYTSIIVGLTKSTTYHYRAYVENEYGRTYGQDLTFTTPAYTHVFYKGDYVNKNKKAYIVR